VYIYLESVSLYDKKMCVCVCVCVCVCIQICSLDNLEYDLLIEILSRLHTAKSAFALKVVSKKWCSIISTSLYFITKFIMHHMNQKSSSSCYYYYAAYQNPLLSCSSQIQSLFLFAMAMIKYTSLFLLRAH